MERKVEITEPGDYIIIIQRDNFRLVHVIKGDNNKLYWHYHGQKEIYLISGNNLSWERIITKVS